MISLRAAALGHHNDVVYISHNNNNYYLFYEVQHTSFRSCHLFFTQ